MEIGDELPRQRRTQRTFIGVILTLVALVVLANVWLEVFLDQSPRPRAYIGACVANLKAIDGAKTEWALANHKTTNDVPVNADLFNPNGYMRMKPDCPKGGTYTLGSVGEKPRCSIPGHTI